VRGDLLGEKPPIAPHPAAPRSLFLHRIIFG
jgi:hypothetical protein